MRIQWGEPAVFVGAAAFYAVVATDTVQGGDSGELTSVAATLGVAHPPGYPVFTLLGHAAAQIPVGTVAWRVALVSALAGAWTLFALARALRNIDVSWTATAIALAALGLAPTFVFLSGIAEVFTLNTALAATLFWFAASSSGAQRVGLRSLLLGVLIGLGGANHQTIVLVFPLAIVALVTLFRSPSKTRIVAGLVAGLALGLTPYLYLVLAGGAAGWPRWGQTETLDGFVRHILRADYGTFTLGLLRGDDSAWDHIAAHLTRSFNELGPVVLLLASLGAAVACRGGTSLRPPWLGRALFASWLLSGPVLHALFNIPCSGVGDEISARFDLLPHLFLVVLVALGFDAVLKQLAIVPRFRFARVTLTAGIGTAVLLQAALAVPDVIPRRHTLAEAYGRDALALLPPNALLFSDGDRDFSVLTYLQEAAGERRDVRVIHVALLGHRWYVDELRRREPTLVVPFVPGRALSREIMTSAHGSGRRVFVTRNVAGQMKRGDRLVPFGVVVELLADNIAMPRPDELELHQRSIANRALARPPQTAPPRASDADIPALYTAGYRQLRAAYEHLNDFAGARRCDDAAAEMATRFVTRD